MAPSQGDVADVPARQDGEERLSKASEPAQDGGEAAQAAQMIQRNYRGYRTRRQLSGLSMDPSTRWVEALKEAQYRNATKPKSRQQRPSAASQLSPADPGRAGSVSEAARENWKRIGAVARHAGSGDTSESDDDENMTEEQREEYRRKKLEGKRERQKTAKMMDLQYFLEMVDQKHRYGSHLRTYHNEWKKADTNENFFYWLDYGEGRNVEVPTVSREVLERDQVRYLSKEERMKYLVTVDDEGRLCWAKNGKRITTNTEWKDSMGGIVPKDDDTPTFRDAPQHRASFSSDETSSIESTSSAQEADHYINHDLKQAKGLKKVQKVSAATVLNHLLRRSIKPNTWIFVADTSFRLYVGIKQSGAFQHSSFLNGARIASAGLIKIKDGQLRRLSPLSGHYRPPTKNFRAFVHSLRDDGVDMSRVSISRSYAVLVGLETYVRARKKVEHGVQHVSDQKDKVLHPEEYKEREEKAKDKSKSAEKERQILEAKAKEEAEVRRKRSWATKIKEKLKLKGNGKHNAKGPSPKVLSTPGEDVESAIPPEGKR